MMDGCDKAAHRGLARAPASYRLRRLYLYALLPRWGGSYRDMRAFALASLPHADRNPRLHALGGFVDWDLGQLAAERGDDSVAFQYHERALAYGPEVDFRRARSYLEMRHKAYGGALVEIDAALSLRPDDAELVCRRAVLLAAVGRADEAATVLARAEQLDPAQPRLGEDRAYIARVAAGSGSTRPR
jgi:tetratricopeptide (TPR) repeat protein